MKTRTLLGRPRWFAFLAALWMLLGTLLLVLLTIESGSPIPARVPEQPLPLLGFLIVTAFIYMLPIWLVMKERQYSIRLGERPSYGAYAFGALTFFLLWGMILTPWPFS